MNLGEIANLFLFFLSSFIFHFIFIYFIFYHHFFFFLICLSSSSLFFLILNYLFRKNNSIHYFIPFYFSGNMLSPLTPCRGHAVPFDPLQGTCCPLWPLAHYIKVKHTIKTSEINTTLTSDRTVWYVIGEPPFPFNPSLYPIIQKFRNHSYFDMWYI